MELSTIKQHRPVSIYVHTLKASLKTKTKTHEPHNSIIKKIA